MQPQQVVSSFILILHLGVVSPYTFRPVVKLIVLPGFGIRQSKQIVSVSAKTVSETTLFQYGLCQHYLWMPDAIADDFPVEIGNSERRKFFSFRNLSFFSSLIRRFFRGDTLA